MFLFADLLCCSVAFTVIYGMFNKNISRQLGFYSVVAGLAIGLLLFPDQSFSRSILIGNIFPVSYFPNWISTALLFWSFVLATFLPVLIVLIFNKKNRIFDFDKIKNQVKDLR